MKIKKGDRYTNYLGKFCIVKSIYKGIVKLQVIDDFPYTEVWSIEDFKKREKFLMKLPMPKIDRTNLAKYLLEYQFNMIGKTLYESKRTKNWKDKWVMTREDLKFHRMYSIPLIKKTLKVNTHKAEEIFTWWRRHFGLNLNE